MNKGENNLIKVLVFEDEESYYKELWQNIANNLNEDSKFVEPIWCHNSIEYPVKKGIGTRTLKNSDLCSDNCDIIIIDLKISGGKRKEWGGIDIIEKIMDLVNPCKHVFVNSAWLKSISLEDKQLLEKAKQKLGIVIFDKNNIDPLVNFVSKLVINKRKLIYLPLQLQQKIFLMSMTDDPVLILGEQGTGKQQIAENINKLWIEYKCKDNDYFKKRHRESPDKYFFSINCSLLNEHFLKDDLFGHKKGSFTGALEDKIGIAFKACCINKYSEINGKDRLPDQGQPYSTLFLDEVGDLRLECQAMFLRFIERPYAGLLVGWNYEIENIRPRIIAATNNKEWFELANIFKTDIKTLRKKGEVKETRSDLFHRLAIHILYIPPLSSNEVRKLLEIHKEKNWDEEAIKHLENLVSEGKIYGNRRGLRNIIHRAELYVKNAEIVGLWGLETVTKELLEDILQPIKSTPSDLIEFVSPIKNIHPVESQIPSDKSYWDINDFENKRKMTSGTREYYILKLYLENIGKKFDSKEVIEHIDNSEELESIRLSNKWETYKNKTAFAQANTRLRYKINEEKIVELSGIRLFPRGYGAMKVR